MRKTKIAFDLDGTLIDLLPPINKWLYNLHGVKFNNNDKSEFSMEISTGLSSDELWKVFRRAYKEIETTPIFPGATELLTKLYEKTNEPPLIITARPHDSASDTYAIMEKIMGNIPFQLILKHPNAYKSQYLNGYIWYVEDRRKTALELSKLGFVIPLIKTNYNYIPDIDEHDNIYYIDGVHELIPHIDNFISKGLN